MNEWVISESDTKFYFINKNFSAQDPCFMFLEMKFPNEFLVGMIKIYF